jgi:hypothetical protein
VPLTTTTDLRADLRTMAQGFRAIGANAGAWLIPEFVLRAGIDCIPQPLPRGYRRRTPKMCFANTAALVRRALGLTYVEGYVATSRVMFPVHHAWAINADNEVIDPTLGDPALCAYVGVPITREDYETLTRKGKSASALLDEVGCVRVDYMAERCPALRELMSQPC